MFLQKGSPEPWVIENDWQRLDMANKQLEGRIFNREGTNYLVLAGNDWNSGTVKVKTVDAKRSVSDMPLKVVLRCVGNEGRSR